MVNQLFSTLKTSRLGNSNQTVLLTIQETHVEMLVSGETGRAKVQLGRSEMSDPHRLS